MLSVMGTSDNQSGQAPPGEIIQNEIRQSKQKAAVHFSLITTHEHELACVRREQAVSKNCLNIRHIFLSHYILKHYFNGKKIFYSMNTPEFNLATPLKWSPIFVS